MKTPHDVLGVSATANSSEIREAYLKRVKVLHPDRFDKATQADAWQMANDMLKELNDAYAGLTSRRGNTADRVGTDGSSIISCSKCGTKNRVPGSISEANCGRCGVQLPIHSEPRTTNAGFDVEKTQSCWNELGQILGTHSKLISNVEPMDVTTLEIHSLSLREYICDLFGLQAGIAGIDDGAADPLVKQAIAAGKEFLHQFSSLATRKVTLVDRLYALTEKYPTWKKLLLGYTGLGAGTAEVQADDREWKHLCNEISGIGVELQEIETSFRKGIEMTAMELIAKYGDRGWV